MRRPLAAFPRGPRKVRQVEPCDHLLIPRLHPVWELAALAALMKPQKAAAVRNLRPTQAWSSAMARDVTGRVVAAGGLMNLSVKVDVPVAGDFLWVARWTVPADVDPALAAAMARGLALVAARGDVWVKVGQVWAAAGKFHKRERGTGLKVVAAPAVRLTRDVRQVLRPYL